MQKVFVLPDPTIKSSELYGSTTSRFIAFLIDTTILVFSYSFVLYGLSESAQQFSSWDKGMHVQHIQAQLLETGRMIFYNPYFPILHWLYCTILHASKRQATIGKFTLGLKVTDFRGKRISFIHANLRYFAKILSVAPICLGFVLMLSTRRKQTLHDYISRTVVVNV